jgi:hypothetical protein
MESTLLWFKEEVMSGQLFKEVVNLPCVFLFVIISKKAQSLKGIVMDEQLLQAIVKYLKAI